VQNKSIIGLNKSKMNQQTGPFTSYSEPKPTVPNLMNKLFVQKITCKPILNKNFIQILWLSAALMASIISAIILLWPAKVLAESSFPDVPENYVYSQAIQYLQGQGIIKGYPDGTFKPENTVNRAEFTKIIIGAKLGAEPVGSAANCFPDVSQDQWFASYVCYAKDNGIITGYPDGQFKPENTINLVETAKILVNTLEVPKTEPQGGEWYSVYLEALGDNGYLPDSFTYLEQNVTRGQMAEMTWRILQQVRGAAAANPDTLQTAQCYPINENPVANVNWQQVRDTWLGWYNAARAETGLSAYSYNKQLERTAKEWSDYSASIGVMSHKRPGTTAYYDYNAITAWFKERGLIFKNINRVTYSENIGTGFYSCNQADCTQKLIDAIRPTFDFYMAEKNSASQPHYQSVMNKYFTEIGLGVAMDERTGKIYITVHYGTEIISDPMPICGDNK
jgi:uncharacterized protein YkwD